MFFHPKKKNALLYQASGPQSSRSGIHVPFHKNFFAWKIGGMVFFVLLAGGMLAYGLFFSTEFQVTSIRVEGASADDAAAITLLAQNAMQQRILRIIPENSYFLFPEDDVRSSLQSQFPRLTSIILSRPNPNSVVISVSERSIVGIWCPSTSSGQALPSPSGGNSEVYPAQSEGCAFFDKEGVIFEQAPNATFGHLLFVLHDVRTQTMPPLGSHVLKNTAYPFLQNLRAALANVGRIPVFFTIKNEEEIDADFLDGNHAWKVYFSTTYGAAYQADVLTHLISNTIGDKNFPYLDYVDLRVENKAYYYLASK